MTGLRIGAGRDTIEIGGLDNPVIKHPHTQRPYIPGSSLKGKLRSLLEWALHRVENNGEVWGSRRGGTYQSGDPILRVFGTTRDDWTDGPTRLIVRDALLNPEWERRTLESGLPLTEDKTEVTIDRLQGKAAAMGPRTMERVPAGAEFLMEMLFKVYSVDGDGGERDWHCLERLLEGLKLLEQDALGGSGSRGYGRVQVRELKIDGRDIQAHLDGIRLISLDAPAPLARS
jgi:CRISPR-associated protein Csm3